MIRATVVAFALAVASIAMSTPSASAAQPIAIYDLSHIAGLNLDDPAQVRQAWDEAHLVSCLQGIVNRRSPRLYLDAIHDGGRSIDRYWLDKLTAPGAWLHGRQFETVPNLQALIARFRRDVRGAVVWDPAVPATSNLASTIAGCDNLLPLRYDPDPASLYSRVVLSGPKLPVKVWLINPDGTSIFTGRGTVPDTSRPSTGSAKADAYVWAIEHYLKPGRCSNRHLAYYIDGAWLSNPRAGGSVWNHTLTNHDYFVSNRAFFFDLSPWDDEPATDDRSQPLGTDVALLKEILAEVYRHNGGRRMCHIGGFLPWAFKYTDAAGGKHEGVPSEWRFSEIISAYNAYLDADALGIGAMANASFYAHMPLSRRYPQRRPPSAAELARQGYLTPGGQVAPKRYVAFYVGDYDSAAWLYRMVPSLWDHPDRGKVPLSWAFNPNLADRAAPAMVYTRQTASPADVFIAGDSGAGYINPGLLEPPRRWSNLPSGTDTWARHCRRYYSRWDIRVTGFIIDGYAPPMPNCVLDAYESFSPGGIVAQKVPPLSIHGQMPVIRMDYDLTQSPAESAQTMLSRLRGDLSRPPAEPTFHVFRAILKDPGWYKQLVDDATRLQPNAAVTVVDLPTLLALERIHLSGMGARGG